MPGHDTWSIFGSQIGSKTEAKKIQKRSDNPRWKKAIQDGIGSVLGQSWVDLGPILGSILAIFCWKTWVRVKIRFVEDKMVWRCVRDRLGREKAPKRPQHGSQEGPKIDPETNKNQHRNRHEFWCENHEGLLRSGPQIFGRDFPSGSYQEVPQEPREQSQGAGSREPGPGSKNAREDTAAHRGPKAVPGLLILEDALSEAKKSV